MTNRLLRYLAILTITAHCYFASAAEFVDYLRPAVKNGGFSMNGYCIWCSSIVKVGDTFHMFASRWPAQY